MDKIWTYLEAETTEEIPLGAAEFILQLASAIVTLETVLQIVMVC